MTEVYVKAILQSAVARPVAIAVTGREDSLVYRRVAALTTLLKENKIDVNILIVNTDSESVRDHLHTTAEVVSIDDWFDAERMIIAASLEVLVELEAFGFTARIIWCSLEVGKQLGEGILHQILLSIVAAHTPVFAPNPIAAKAWFLATGLKPLILDPQLTDAPRDIAPIIERTEKLRILVDAVDAVTNIPLIEPFVVLENKDCEVWCLSRAVLKSWMKPDMYIVEILEDEWDLYLSSVDAAILTSRDEHSEGRCNRYQSRGIVTLSIDGWAEETLNTSSAFVIEGSLQNKINWLLADSARLRECQTTLKAICSKKLEEDRSTALNRLIDAGNSSSINARPMLGSDIVKRYLKLRYSDERGSDLHRNFGKVRDRAVQSRVEGLPRTLLMLSGWAADARYQKAADFLLVSQEAVLPSSVRRFSRPDVEATLSLPKEEFYGVEISLLFDNVGEFINADEMLSQLTQVIVSSDGKRVRVLLSGIVRAKDEREAIISRLFRVDGLTIEVDNSDLVGNLDEATAIEGILFLLRPEWMTGASVVLKFAFEVHEPPRTLQCFFILRRKGVEVMIQQALDLTIGGIVNIPDNIRSYMFDCDQISLWLPLKSRPRLRVFADL